jgi:hypothetical protein
MVATDRLSAFDVVLQKEFHIESNSKPDCYKFMELTDIVPNWLIATPDLM